MPVKNASFDEATRFASKQACVDKILEVSEEMWSEVSCDPRTPWEDPLGDDEPPLPRPTVQQFKTVCFEFGLATGLGQDIWHPRQIATASDETISAVIDLLEDIECGSPFPTNCSTTYFFQTGKKDGTTRGVGQLPSLTRIWERIRKEYADEWVSRNERAYNWASKGRSAEVAVWTHACQDEIAILKGEAVASALLDLQKAFEYVQLFDVWRAASAANFCMRVLRVVLTFYAGQRRMVLEGAFSEATKTVQAIVPGSVYATLCLYIVLQPEIDRLILAHPSVAPRLFVDDLVLQTHGSQQEVVANMSAALCDLVEGMERKGWRVSRGKGGKTVFLASSNSVLAGIRKATAHLKLKPARVSEYLGVDYNAGRRRRTNSSRSRFAKIPVGEPGLKLSSVTVAH